MGAFAQVGHLHRVAPDAQRQGMGIHHVWILAFLAKGVLRLTLYRPRKE
jgi:hypothetical protein